jgi:hypothetical protein
LYPNQATRPEWAHRLGCWSCETYLNIFNLETPEHALIKCPLISNIRSEVLRNFGLLNISPQLTTNTHLMWGLFQAQPCNKPSTLLGNLINNLVTVEIIKIRNLKKADLFVVCNNIRDSVAVINKAKPNGKIACEVAAKKMGAFFQNPRPPENSASLEASPHS